MAIELAFTEAKELFTGTSIFGLDWLMLVLITGLSLFIISRHVQSWKHLAFPVLIGWYTSGLKSWSLFDAMLLVSAGVMFVVEALSIETASKLIETVREKSLDIITRTTHETREIVKEAKRAAKAKAHKGVFERTEEQLLRKDIIKAAGKIKGLSPFHKQSERQRKQALKEARLLQSERRWETAKEKAAAGVAKQAMDLAPGQAEKGRIDLMYDLEQMRARGLLTEAEVDKRIPKRSKYKKERAMRVRQRIQEAINKAKRDRQQEEEMTNEN